MGSFIVILVIWSIVGVVSIYIKTIEKGRILLFE